MERKRKFSELQPERILMHTPKKPCDCKKCQSDPQLKLKPVSRVTIWRHKQEQLSKPCADAPSSSSCSRFGPNNFPVEHLDYFSDLNDIDSDDNRPLFVSCFILFDTFFWCEFSLQIIHFHTEIINTYLNFPNNWTRKRKRKIPKLKTMRAKKSFVCIHAN